MTTPFLAGQKLRAADLNDLFPVLCRATADTSRTSSTTLLNATGLAATLEANTAYLIDGYLAYDAGETGDLRAAFSIPAGASGHWSMLGIGTGTTGSIGDTSAVRASALTTAIAVGGSAAFSSALVALPRGYVLLGGTAGAVQLQFAQNTSSGTPTTIRAGSWLRFTKVLA